MRTVSDVAIEIRRLAEESPDKVYGQLRYGQCYYTTGQDHTTGEGCIVGQALVRVGVPLEWLKRVDDSNDMEVIGRNLGTSVGTVIPTLVNNDMLAPGENYKETLEWLARVQSEQDRLVPWGEAVRRADEWRKL